MKPEALQTLLRLRRSDTEEARLALTEAIATETAVSALVVLADQRILGEARAALSLGADDGAVEAYARWLPIGRREATQARVRLGRATSDVGAARITLMLARKAELAIEQRVARVEREMLVKRSRAEQAELDEIAARTAASEPSWR